jgi:2'-hydroxyisoflavone reductase
MRLLILGGTGFIDPHQVRYALARGHHVTIFKRGRQKEAWPGPVEELIGDRHSDLKALEGGDWNVRRRCRPVCATLPHAERACRPVRLYLNHFGICRQRQAGRRDRPTRGIQLRRPHGRDDQLVERRPAPLRALKALSEKEVLTQYGEAAATIIRPSLIVGPGDETDRFTYWPVRLARGGDILAPDDGSDPVQFIDVRDLAEWTIGVAEQHITGVFNASGPALSITMQEMLTGIAQGVQVDPKLVWTPTAYLKANKVSSWRDMPVWIPGEGETFGFHRRDIRRAIAAGLTYRPLPLTAADTLAWFLTLPSERQAKLRAGVAPEREAELLAKLRA